MFEQEIEKGVEWLNEKYPDWEEEIDLEILDMFSVHTCILGQLYGVNGYSVLVNKFFSGKLNHFDCGFSIRMQSDIDSCFNKLTSEWKQKILELRSK